MTKTSCGTTYDSPKLVPLDFQTFQQPWSKAEGGFSKKGAELFKAILDVRHDPLQRLLAAVSDAARSSQIWLYHV